MHHFTAEKNKWRAHVSLLLLPQGNKTDCSYISFAFPLSSFSSPFSLFSLFTTLPLFLAEPPLSIMNTIFRVLATQPIVKYGGAALLAYMALVRFLRYKRINALLRKYPDPTIPFRNLDAAREVSSVVSELDFPFMYILSLEYALFKTYSIPSISKLLVATKEFKNNGFKRTDDTFLIGLEFLEVHGRNSRRAMMEGKVDEWERMNDEQRADLAMERLNFIHGQYNIKQGDYLYTFSQIVLETPSFIGRFEWRPLQEIEKNVSLLTNRLNKGIKSTGSLAFLVLTLGRFISFPRRLFSLIGCITVGPWAFKIFQDH